MNKIFYKKGFVLLIVAAFLVSGFFVSVPLAFASPSDLTTLIADITTANALLPVIEGTVPGNYIIGSSVTLSAAITTASAITSADDQSVVDAADVTLNAAVTVFNAAIVPPISGGGGLYPSVGGSGEVSSSMSSSVITTPSISSSISAEPPTLIAEVSDTSIVPATTLGNSGNVSPVGQVLGAQSFHFTLPLKKGSKGNEVMELQKFLNAAGYDAGKSDGFFGAKVKAAVIKFQLANGLKGDGVVGPKLRAFLNK